MFDKPMVRRSIIAMRRMWVGTLVLMGLASTQLHAQSLRTLASLNGSSGAYPYDGVTLIGNSLFGTTSTGGPNRFGTLFSLPVSGGTPAVLVSFNTGTSVGNIPNFGLTSSGNVLFGTTGEGGARGYGALYSIAATGGTPTALASFDLNTSGCAVLGRLIISGNVLYGTAQAGGANSLGTVFSVPMSGGTPTVLTSFSGDNGGYPLSSLTLVGSTFYGTTSTGGLGYSSSNLQGGYGTVFSLPITGGTPTTLALFNGSNGAKPIRGLTLVGDTLYGTTENGGASGLGTIFSVPIGGGTPTVLASFSGSNGSYPTGGLTLVGSTLYGTTYNGGVGYDPGRDYSGDGTVFSVSVGGGSITDLALFDGSDGATPVGDLIFSGNTLYGATESGGANFDGTVFALDLPATPEPSTLALLAAGTLALAGFGFWRRRRNQG